jgi:hypothetical protein
VLPALPAPALPETGNTLGPVSAPALSDRICAYLWKMEPQILSSSTPHLGSKLLDQAMLVENYLEQFFPAQRFQIPHANIVQRFAFQWPGLLNRVTAFPAN